MHRHKFCLIVMYGTWVRESFEDPVETKWVYEECNLELHPYHFSFPISVLYSGIYTLVIPTHATYDKSGTFKYHVVESPEEKL